MIGTALSAGSHALYHTDTVTRGGLVLTGHPYRVSEHSLHSIARQIRYPASNSRNPTYAWERYR
jgi:hypothetical protein